MVKKPPLNDLFLRKIVAAMIIYPKLSIDYEEQLMSFEIEKSPMAKILNEIIEIVQEDKSIDSDIMIEKLKLNFKTEIENLWELNMYKLQKTDFLDLKTEINEGLKEIQLKQIDKEIKECMTLIKQAPENADENYNRYKQLIVERNKFLATEE